MKIALTLINIIFLLSTEISFAQKSPVFLKGEDPKSSNQKWELNRNMSDEFKGNKINKTKWFVTKATGWVGRAPGLFIDDAVQVKDGELQITNSLLPKPVTVNGSVFTHGCGLVASKYGAKYGYYETSMKANKTFLSSTFWLINHSGNQTGCDKRTTELDVQECVGQVTGTAKFAQNADQRMGSNTHSRNIPVGCDYEKGSAPHNAAMKGKAYDDYHVYGVWWKSKDEVQFFLDGKMVGSVTPPADFNIEMHLRMVTEAYDWNPVPADGGLTGTKEDRTTYYKWVRSWKLVE